MRCNFSSTNFVIFRYVLSEPTKMEQLRNPSKNDLRSYQERRQNHIKIHKLLFIKGQRRTLQRSEDGKRIIILDQYHPTLLICALIVLGLSLLDAALTLVLLTRGAVELNPVMRYYINLGPKFFLLVKYGLTSLAVVFLVVLKPILSVRFRIASSLLFPFCVFVFGSVVIWELYLLIKFSLL